ncbi:MAG: hypothetical protein ACRDPE_03700 [Solirubrobacterales bacterium]
MRIVVTAQAFDDLEDGSPVVWGYHHEEQIPQEVASEVDFGAVLRGDRAPTREELESVERTSHQNSSAILEALTLRLEEARESIVSQAAAGLPDRSGS